MWSSLNLFAGLVYCTDSPFNMKYWFSLELLRSVSWKVPKEIGHSFGFFWTSCVHAIDWMCSMVFLFRQWPKFPISRFDMSNEYRACAHQPNFFLVELDVIHTTLSLILTTSISHKAWLMLSFLISAIHFGKFHMVRRRDAAPRRDPDQHPFEKQSRIQHSNANFRKWRAWNDKKLSGR